MAKNEKGSSVWLIGGAVVLIGGALLALKGQSAEPEDTTLPGGGGVFGGSGVFDGGLAGGTLGGGYNTGGSTTGTQNPTVVQPGYYDPSTVARMLAAQQAEIDAQRNQASYLIQQQQALAAREAGMQLADSLNTGTLLTTIGASGADVSYGYSEALGGGYSYATSYSPEVKAGLASGTIRVDAKQNVPYVDESKNMQHLAFVDPARPGNVVIVANQRYTGGKADSDSSSDGWSGGGGGKASGVSSSGSFSGGGSYVDVDR